MSNMVDMDGIRPEKMWRDNVCFCASTVSCDDLHCFVPMHMFAQKECGADVAVSQSAVCHPASSILQDAGCFGLLLWFAKCQRGLLDTARVRVTVDELSVNNLNYPPS